MSALLVLILIITSLTSAKGLGCYPRSCNGSKHTLCKYDVDEFGSKCNIVQFNRLNQHFKKEIIFIHSIVEALSVIENNNSNQSLTNSSQISTVRVKRFKWSDELALIAQRWSNQCEPGYDECRDIDNFKVGQKFENLRSNSINKFVMYDLIKNWSPIEITDYDDMGFNGEELPSFINDRTIIWDGIMSIGCGIIRFLDVEGWYNTYLVCNYHQN